MSYLKYLELEIFQITSLFGFWNIDIYIMSWLWWHMTRIPETQEVRLPECKFEARLCNLARLCLEIKYTKGGDGTLC